MLDNNDMNKNDWTQQLRHRLKDRQESVPDDWWDGIASAMEQKAAKSRRSRIIPLYRWMSAAAVGLVLVIGGTYYIISHDAGEDPLAVSTKIIKPMRQVVSSVYAKAEGEELMAVNTMTDNANRSPMAALTGCLPSADERTAVASCTEIQDHAASDGQPAPSVQDAPSVSSTPDAVRQKHGAATSAHSGKMPLPAVGGDRETGKSGTGGLHVGLHASNAFGSQNSMTSVMLSQNLTSMYNHIGTADDPLPAVRTNYTEKKHHRQPLSVGLSVGYALSDRLSLQTGVSYTWMESDFVRSAGYDEVTDHQRLDYVGVPVGLTYRVWGNRSVRTYVSAGAQADFNVSAKVESEGAKYNIEKDRVQFSLGAAAGVEYRLVPNVGVYVEPGVKYYVDNGSRVENALKEKPCNFSLELGVRLSLNK